jgi:maltooligosyltrehalose trehalohydrolase
MKIGAHYLGDGNCEFVVWAPFRRKVELKIISNHERTMTMNKDKLGYWNAVLRDVYPGTLYSFRLDGEIERPDPASCSQPDGVHGPSQIVDLNSFHWDDGNWSGVDIAQMIMYEIHTGTFTPEGTFEAIIPRLGEILDLGINAIELMPVAQFPGERNWGYDGAFPYAPQNSYGGPDGLWRLINECHKKGISVILDVVYNHLGPEGNYLWDYGPYFTDKYRTPWGNALNFDDAYSNEVRIFFIENALYWFREYHVDALRLDAVHAIYDFSAKHILQELGEKAEDLSKKGDRDFYLIAESDLNDSRIIDRREFGGYGIDAQWCDDFHHSLHTLLTGEDLGYYVDFGKTEHLIRALKEGFVYSGQYSVYRKRRHGNSPKESSGEKFVVYSQNHDHIGNRLHGDRLSALVSFEGLKLAAGVVLLAPYIPFLFMGEEYGEDVPFLYFVSHSDPNLIEAVRRGRKGEFESFDWKGEPSDPQSPATFFNSNIDWKKRNEGSHNVLLNYYKTLIKIRKDIPALTNLDKDNLEVWGLEKEKVVFMRRWDSEQDSHVFSIFNLNESNLEIPSQVPDGRWRKLVDSSEEKWNGPGSLIPEIIESGGVSRIGGFSMSLFKRM